MSSQYNQHADILPTSLKSEHPLRINIATGIQNYSSWMGHAINPRGVVHTPVGTLYYMLWAEMFSRHHKRTHIALVVDEPLRHDGVPDSLVKSKSNEKKKALEGIIESFGLSSIQVATWDEFKTNGRYDDLYRDIFEAINCFSRKQPDAFRHLIADCVPVHYRCNPSSYLYVVDEMTAILYLSIVGSPIRIGHHESRLDKALKQIIEHKDFRLGGKEQSHVLYLRGDYPLNAEVFNDNILPPTKERNPKRRIVLSDDLSNVIGKLSGSTKFYRRWIKSILCLRGFDPRQIQNGELAQVAFSQLLQPLQTQNLYK